MVAVNMFGPSMNPVYHPSQSSGCHTTTSIHFRNKPSAEIRCSAVCIYETLNLPGRLQSIENRHFVLTWREQWCDELWSQESVEEDDSLRIILTQMSWLALRKMTCRTIRLDCNEDWKAFKYTLVKGDRWAMRYKQEETHPGRGHRWHNVRNYGHISKNLPSPGKG